MKNAVPCETAVLEFDYSQFDGPSRRFLLSQTEKIRQLAKRVAQDIVEIGRCLIRVKDRIGHGHFLAWIHAEFGWSRVTAWRFMRVAEKCYNLKHLECFSPSALYLLVAESTPDWVRDDAMERAQRGEQISHKLLASLLAELDGDSNEADDADWEPPEPEYLPDGTPEATYKLDVHFSSESDEWYTPSHIVERVMKVMRKIDLDPCSNSARAPNIPARRHFTVDDDGLAHPWTGRVYMNPPYGRAIGDWIYHLCDQYDAGTVSEAIALVPARTDTDWFRRTRGYPKCFFFGRLHFSDTENAAPLPFSPPGVTIQLLQFETFERLDFAGVVQFSTAILGSELEGLWPQLARHVALVLLY